MQKVYTLPEGTLLYRSAPNICNYTYPKILEQFRECEDTGKCGVYFSTYIFQALAMTVEYNKNLELGIFQTTAPITLSVGKYSTLHNKNHGSIHLISHTNRTYPILDNENDSKYSLNLNVGEGEVFIADPRLLESIKLIDSYSIHYNELQKYIKSVNSLSLRNTSMYLKDPIVTKISCYPPTTKDNIIHVKSKKTRKMLRKHRKI